MSDDTCTVGSERDSTQKLVVNREFGGFSVHDDTVRWMRERGCPIAEELTLPGEQYGDGSERDVDGFRDSTYPCRSDIRLCEHLVAAVEEGVARDLSIVEVPEGVEWVITEYDGAETVREKHRVFPSGNYAEGIVTSDEIDEKCSLHTDSEHGGVNDAD